MSDWLSQGKTWVPRMTSTQVETLDRMQCMEVWGGNSPVDRSFATPGLEFWIHSRPYEQADQGGDAERKGETVERQPRSIRN